MKPEPPEDIPALEQDVQRLSLMAIRQVVWDIYEAVFVRKEDMTQAQANFLLKVRKDVRLGDMAVARKDMWSRMKPATLARLHGAVEASIEADYELIDGKEEAPAPGRPIAPPEPPAE